MCTVSVVSSFDRSAVRLLFNRDERRLRPLARPPVVQAAGDGHALWPTDPVSEGTWIAANDAGLVFALMNTDGHRTEPDMTSRGTLIPSLAHAASIPEAVARWRAIDTTVFAPFRLVVANSEQIVMLTRGCSEPAVLPGGRAHVFSSSSLGDAVVEGPRRGLLVQMLRAEPDPWMAQTRFHHHAWPDRRHMSVMMSRADACTVSCTEVILASGSVGMHYRPIVDGWPVATSVRSLPLRHGAGRAAA
jgi:hypothetical protein